VLLVQEGASKYYYRQKEAQQDIPCSKELKLSFFKRLRKTKIMKPLKLIFIFQIFNERKSEVFGYKLYEFWEDGLFPISTGRNKI